MHGKRVTNEKLAYNESAQAFFKWDPTTSEYPNLVLVAIWDQRSQDNSAGDERAWAPSQGTQVQAFVSFQAFVSLNIDGSSLCRCSSL